MLYVKAAKAADRNVTTLSECTGDYLQDGLQRLARLSLGE
jgi:hypothetical protein